MTTDGAWRAMLDRLAAEADITRLLYRYCHAADSCDLDAFRLVFHADSTHDHAGIFGGLSHDFGAFALDVFARDVPVTQHHIGNILIDIGADADRASSVCYFLAYHRVPAAMDTTLMKGHRPGRDEVYWVGGRYLDRIERRGGGWKIAHRTAVHDWEQWDDVRDGRHLRPETLRARPSTTFAVPAPGRHGSAGPQAGEMA